MENENHYLAKIILESTDGSDSKVIEEVKKKLPEGFTVNSDDTFLTVECLDLVRNSNKSIAEKIGIPVETISLTTLKRCCGYDNKIVYFCWDKIIDDMEILS